MGFGKNKIAAIPAIKSVIEKGSIVSFAENYKNIYDRYVIAAKGTIDGKSAIISVVVNSYKENNINKFYLHEVEIIKADVSSMTAPQLSVDTVNTSASDDSISNSAGNVNSKNKESARDSDGNTLSEQQQEYFKDSKIRDEDGNLLVVYHGTDAEFTVFDKTKGRANMDIQGMFFSQWDIDAGGYGGTVKAYYLNITNPASEGMGYKALNMFKGQNNAGIKAREYLESLGYDGVNNGDEEYIAFNSNQIKLVDNTAPTDNEDIRYSTRDDILADEDNIKAEYGITKLNDYIHVQKQINKTLRKEGFFTNPDGISRTEINEQNGMSITINQSGINETFNAENYAHNSKLLKLAKMLTIKNVPEIIKTGTVIADDVENIHGKKNVKFAYIEGTTKVDNLDIAVRLAIKKSSVSNKFWVHYVDIKENISESTSADDNNVKQTAFKSADIDSNSTTTLSKSQELYSDRDPEAQAQLEKVNRQLERANAKLTEDLKSAILTKTNEIRLLQGLNNDANVISLLCK